MPIVRLVDLLLKKAIVDLAGQAPQGDLSRQDYVEGDALPMAARMLLDVWDDPEELERVFERVVARGFIRHTTAAIRHQEATRLARAFGVEPDRLIRWMKAKYPWFTARKASGAQTS
jgi:acetolactate synthase regulatory subunit